jgi:hypothetical protein
LYDGPASECKLPYPDPLYPKSQCPCIKKLVERLGGALTYRPVPLKRKSGIQRYKKLRIVILGFGTR